MKTKDRVKEQASFPGMSMKINGLAYQCGNVVENKGT
jgi:hypothetical protein